MFYHPLVEPGFGRVVRRAVQICHLVRICSDVVQFVKLEAAAFGVVRDPIKGWVVP